MVHPLTWHFLILAHGEAIAVASARMSDAAAGVVGGRDSIEGAEIAVLVGEPRTGDKITKDFIQVRSITEPEFETFKVLHGLPEVPTYYAGVSSRSIWTWNTTTTKHKAHFYCVL